MFWFLYNVLFVTGFTLLVPVFLRRMLRRGGYRRDFGHRFGRYPAEVLRRLEGRRTIWIHAVSVGECNVALRYLAEIRRRDPEVVFVLTTTTSTGYRLAGERMDPRDAVFYVPVDLPLFVNRALDAFKPGLFILTEKEIWPNMIRLAHRRGIPVVIVNALLSESSLRGYRRMAPVTRRIMGCMSAVLAQTDEAGKAFAGLGVAPDRVHVCGTAKYDFDESLPASAAKVHAVLEALGFTGAGPLLVGGSTWAGEEAALLRIFGELKRVSPGARLVLVPRHAERADAVEAEIAATGLGYVRRSRMHDAQAPANVEVLLADTTGELPGYYADASMVFVGKSLTAHGAQNMLEPAVSGIPVLVGPHCENFAEVVRQMLAEDALVQVADEASLLAAVLELAQDPQKAAGLGARARGFVQSRQGVVRRSVDILAGSGLLPS